MAAKISRLPANLPALTAREEAFACEWVATGGSQIAAYRKAYEPRATTRDSTLYGEASRVARRPQVAERIRALRDAAAAHSIIRAADLIEDWLAQARADPRELVRLERNNCTRCRGIGHAVQWVDETEWLAACVYAHDNDKPLPSADGGFGYNPLAEPVEGCPGCHGRGVLTEYIEDSRNLSPEAAKLYAGVEQTTMGIKVKMHDPNKARENLARMMGYFKDGVPQTPPKMPDAPIPEGMSAEDAAKAYQRLLRA